MALATQTRFEELRSAYNEAFQQLSKARGRHSTEGDLRDAEREYRRTRDQLAQYLMREQSRSRRPCCVHPTF